ncbi:hypothetical protein [Stenotrophomonas maltophilia]|uniref:hypothetical protein n=1 Tax=Stenotrophomonas maltophilia TaxID=40324 RepID=UPI0015DDB83E|nr:hypothetical protein [Stenotrophomonas maltophilia]MBA0446141.1 hypothetical protein [Stenotrophomonas maltophilia]
MRKIVENEISYTFIEEVLFLTLRGDRKKLKREYRIAKELACTIIKEVEPGGNLACVSWFEDEELRGLPFDTFLVGKKRQGDKNKLFVQADGKKIWAEGAEEIVLFILFQKCKGSPSFSPYERTIRNVMFAKTNSKNPGFSVIAEWLK